MAARGADMGRFRGVTRGVALLLAVVLLLVVSEAAARQHLRARVTSLLPGHNLSLEAVSEHATRQGEGERRAGGEGEEEELSWNREPPAPSSPPAPLPCGGDLAPDSEMKVHFMLLGQQKCGTSSLWNLLTAHPHIRMAGHRKENFYWGPGGTFHEEMRWDMCLLPTEGYTAFLEADHAFRDVCNGDKIGDFTATHFSCPCCPERFKLLNPDMKLMVVLREPRSRSESRYAEQKSMKGRFSEMPFGELAEHEVEWMQSHSCQPNRYLPPGNPRLDRARELICTARSNVVGWSNYPVFIRNWLEHFPAEQLLVVYTEQFERDPAAVLTAMESFLGVEKYKYPEEVLSHTHYNTGDCGYGWDVGDDSKCEPHHSSARKEAYYDELSHHHHHATPNDAYFDSIAAGMLELAREGRITLPPLSWFAKGRLERVGITREEYGSMQAEQADALQQSGMYPSSEIRTAVKEMVKGLHMA